MSAQRHEEAVSSVVGTVLMLGITVAVFAGFSVVALSYFKDQPQAPRSDLALVQEEGSMYLVHRGGESFSREGGLLYVNNGGVEETVSMSDARVTALVGDDWDLGDQLCVQGTASGCLYGINDDLLGAFFVDEGSLLLAAGDRADPNAYRDLTVALVSQSPASPGNGDSVTWTVRVTNGGTASVPTGAVVAVQVDGVQVATATITQVLSPGEDDTATSTAWTATTGTHVLRLLVDPSNAIVEGNDANNEAVSALYVDPGVPFNDVNGDGIFDPNVDTQMTAAQVTQIESGSFSTSGSLVLPASLEPISADSVSFTADGNIVVAVEITSNNAPLSLTSTNGNIEFDSSALTVVQNNADMTLSAPNGAITAPGLVVEVDGDLRITAGGAVDLSGADLTVTSQNQVMEITGTTVDLTGAVLSNQGNTGNTIAVTSTSGAITAAGVTATSTGVQTWKATGGGITLSSSTLSATTTSLTACLASDTSDGLVLSGTLSFTDANNKLNAQRGASCNTDANADAYVTPWPSAATDSPRSKLE